MNEKTANKAAGAVNLFPEKVNVFHKKIGITTYIVRSRFNGDSKRDMTSALVRLMRNEAAKGIGA